MKVKAAADAELEDRDKGEVNPIQAENMIQIQSGYTQIRLDMCRCMTAVSMGGRP